MEQPGLYDAERAAVLVMPRWLGVCLLLLISTTFASNHIAARLAFDHGVNVLTAVVVRSFCTALGVALLMRFAGASMAMERGQFGKIMIIGLLMAIQSFCLYSSVARMPVALALLAFNTFPFLLGIVSWVGGGERPDRRAWIAMVVTLIGLTLALDVAGKVGGVSAAGVAFALGGSFSFSLVLFLTLRWVPKVDGRIRTLVTMSVVGIVGSIVGLATDGFAWPVDGRGWLGLSLLSLFYGVALTGIFVLLPRIGVVNNAAILNFEPIAALALAWLILGQTIAPIQVFGVLVVIGAIVAISLRGSPPAPAANARQTAPGLRSSGSDPDPS